MKRDWFAYISDMRDRPGEWVVVSQDAPRNLVTKIKQGTLAPFRLPEGRGSYEARWKGLHKGDTRGIVFVRYLPPSK